MAGSDTAKEVQLKLDDDSLRQEPEQVFDILEKLGEGSYGSVFKGLHKTTGQVVAIKQVPIDLQDIIKEISIMQQCESPFIVKYFGSYLKKSDLWIVMEYCGAGSVADLMRKRNKTMNEPQIAAILKATLNGLLYLHNHRKIHRDIKAGNILLNLQGQAKLADFGVAGQLSDSMAKRNTVIGTPFWMAPEVIEEVGYDGKADVWSLGITTIEMGEGKPPYADIHPMRAIFMIPHNKPPTMEFPERFGDRLNNFVATCLQKEPEKRPTTEELLLHPFVATAKPPQAVLGEAIEEAMAIQEEEESVSSEWSEPAGFEDSTIVPGKTPVAPPASSASAGQAAEAGTGASAPMPAAVADSTLLGFDTMIINDDQGGQPEDGEEESSTMKHHSENEAPSNPPFMAWFEGQQSGAQSNNLVHITKLKNMNVEDLKSRLAALGPQKERELKELDRRHDLKRQPILAAIEAKRKAAQ